MASSRRPKYKPNDIIRKLRKDNGYTYRELADLIGINRSTIWDIENGYSQINGKALQLYSDFFHVSYDYLLGQTKQNLIEQGLSDSVILEMLSHNEIVQELQVKAMVILTLMTYEEDIEQVITLMMYMLKNTTSIDVNKEILERYNKIINKKNGQKKIE